MNFDPPANGFRVFGIGPGLFREYREWVREGRGRRLVLDRVSTGDILWVFWRDL